MEECSAHLARSTSDGSADFHNDDNDNHDNDDNDSDDDSDDYDNDSDNDDDDNHTLLVYFEFLGGTAVC